MMLEWSKQALKDRENIFDYISKENVPAAIRTDIRIRDHISQLLIFPESGRKGRLAETSELIVPETHFIVVYAVLPSTPNKIKILRVLHSARQWPE
jgi:toxin ParE1/3/4